MKENDNLEQFFQKSLEDFSAEPSNDMWARIEPIIPPKPPIFGTWLGTAKWFVGLFIVGSLSFGIYQFLESQKEIKMLSGIIEKQQETIEDLSARINDERTNEVVLNSTNLEKNESNNPSLNNETALTNSLESETNYSSNNNLKAQSNRNQTTDNQFLTNNSTYSNQYLTEKEISKENELDQSETVINSNSASSNSNAPIIQKEQLVQHTSLFQLNTRSIPLFENQSTSNPREVKVKKTLNPFPRFSFEGKGGVFAHNLGKIIYSDSSKSANPFSSWQAGLLINFELNTRWQVQTGFLFKNFKTTNTQIRYNTFPILTQYRFGFKNFILHAKSGIILNTLIDAKSGTERVVISNLQSNFIDFMGGLGMDFRINPSTKLSIEPWVSYSLNQVANGKKAFQFGVNLGAKYSIQ
jgi:hypothetical protein